MKQNSSILFHMNRKFQACRYLGKINWSLFAFSCGFLITVAARAATTDQPPEYLTSFDPTKGFKPAQTDLTEIFLQIAGSLESYGTPVPYLRHMKAEHERIEAEYQKRRGTAPKSYCPSYMTSAYLDQFAANWNVLSAKLGLEPVAKDIGGLMRDAILGTRRTGTTVVEILNQHQKHVFDRMAGKETADADFVALQSQLITRLELDKASVDDRTYEIARRDAVESALIIRGVTMKLFARLDQNLKPADAAKIKAALTMIYIDTGRMAQSELEAGIAEWASQQQQTASK